VVNEAIGDAAAITQQAEAYRERATREAAATPPASTPSTPNTAARPGVTRDRIYIETMEQVLRSSNKVVIDAKGATAPIILPPDVFRPKAQAAPQIEVGPAAADARREPDNEPAHPRDLLVGGALLIGLWQTFFIVDQREQVIGGGPGQSGRRAERAGHGRGRPAHEGALLPAAGAA
jgi:regulator of protease activity HflC (stomatin/prohibitin superfamily)